MSDLIVLYFHGYGSSPLTDKVSDLKRSFADVRAPQIPLLFQEAQSTLCDYVESLMCEKRDLIIVGTSLGGYWAGMIGAKYDIPTVLVNPAIDPAKSLVQFDDTRLTTDELAKFDKITKSSSPRMVLLAEDDDIIPPHEAARLFADNAKVQLFRDGGHRFQCPERIADAVKYLAQYNTTDVVND